ncbi:MAG: N-succinylarginine dihydrolase [Aquisalinus sp.]|nr:N-succinylarginine dihydrolase [Aquisalinus sp.]
MSDNAGVAHEVNFDGLVGPTHNYGGLSYGNLASMNNLGAVSNPLGAVLQGIQKMRKLLDLGLVQGVLPPHERPAVSALRHFGFTGTDAEIVEAAAKAAPQLLMNCASASAMWTANAATVSPSADTRDGKVHFTPANLGSMFHRSLEPDFTGRTLKAIFADDTRFSHHAPIPYGGRMGDEGAANHGRLATGYGEQGAELFVYGHSAFEKQTRKVTFQARQAVEASHAIATSHQLDGRALAFVRQSAAAIDAGAFHNDVVSVTNGTALFYHEQAFEDKAEALDAITRACATLEFEPVFIEVPADRVSLETAIKTYLFNSQLVSLPEGGMALILPTESEENADTRSFVDDAIAGNGPITQAHYLDLKQSMKNGGGPACLRLRVVLTEAEQAALFGNCLMTHERLDDLEAWAKKHYRDQMMPEDVSDPQLYQETCAALDELTQLLDLGSLYDFQR